MPGHGKALKVDASGLSATPLHVRPLSCIIVRVGPELLGRCWEPGGESEKGAAGDLALVLLESPTEAGCQHGQPAPGRWVSISPRTPVRRESRPVTQRDIRYQSRRRGCGGGRCINPTRPSGAYGMALGGAVGQFQIVIGSIFVAARRATSRARAHGSLPAFESSSAPFHHPGDACDHSREK